MTDDVLESQYVVILVLRDDVNIILPTTFE